MKPTVEREREERDTATGRLLRAYRQEGDTRARERLVQLYLPLVETLARRHRGPRAEYDDLLQAGSIGLLNAIERYDPERGGEFAAFAVPTVAGEMKRFIRDRSATVRLPRPLAEAGARLPATREALSRKLGRIPSDDELAQALGVEAVDLASIDLGGRGERRRSPGQNQGVSPGDEHLVLSDAFRALDEQEREIVFLRFVEELERREVAERLGISESQLGRRTRVALAKLRRELEEEGSGRAQAATPRPEPDATPPPEPAASSPAPKPGRAGHSGRLLLRMPRSLHDDLAGAAAREGVSLNSFITDTLTAAVARRGGRHEGEAGPGLEVREVPRWLPGAIVANIVVVVLAAIVAIVLLVLAWQNGW